MRLSFDANQEYQLDAIRSAVELFSGQAKTGAIAWRSTSSSLLPEEIGTANALTLSFEQIQENVATVQDRNNIADRISGSSEPHYSFEMETGTGKTYVYLRSIFELNKEYGWTKFIIVVPSVPIREGVLKSLKITKEHFKELYANIPYDYFVYDSKKLGEIRNFATSNTIQIMVINIDAFRGDDRIINKVRDLIGKPIDLIRNTNPIVLIDEPQKVGSEKAKEALDSLNYLFTLRYSATHTDKHNLVYSLNPVQAYDLGLVKKIDVLSVREEHSENDTYIKLLSVTPGATKITATLEIEIDGADGIRKQKVKVATQWPKGQEGKNDLYRVSGNRPAYEGWVVTGFPSQDSIEFANGKVLQVGELIGETEQAIQRRQIEETIKTHLDTQLRLQPQGIKVLSLLFIDEVRNYRIHETGEKGMFAKWFEEIYEQYRSQPQYQTLDLPPASDIHNGYFSKDKSGWVDTTGTTQRDSDTYSLIMRDKEKLLSFDTPLCFIFSHSALREGWDNPNIFQICTLAQSQGEVRKRQEIGRGMRIPVNQQGIRVFDDTANVLTVIANESYESFAKGLQTEIESETSVVFGKDHIRNARSKRKVKLSKGYELNPNFLSLWERICSKTQYHVTFSSELLVTKVVEKLKDVSIPSPSLRVTRARLNIRNEGISGALHADRTNAIEMHIRMPDLISVLAEEVALTKKTILSILDCVNRWDDIIKNPHAFIEACKREIHEVLEDLMVEGIVYERIEGDFYDMQLFRDKDLYGYLKQNMLPLANSEKSVYEHVVYDSETIERPFAEELDMREEVKFFIKLPAWFTIPTPLGTYNPDWAIVFHDDRQVHFVAETKGTNRISDLRREERLKILCAQKHFDVIPDVTFKAPVSELRQVVED